MIQGKTLGSHHAIIPWNDTWDIPQDKIIILEDTNRDGRADKSTVFADQLTVPDGLAFHRDGVIISHQPRLVYMEDTDGDGRADYKRNY